MIYDTVALLEKTKVSVIVPVYNNEKNIDRCVESIVKQVYKNLELILVDDGSEDGSLARCNALADRYPQIQVIHLDCNQGVGAARNAGLDAATGQFVFFFNSGDTVPMKVISACMDFQEDMIHSEIICYGYTDVDSFGFPKKRHVPELEVYYFRGSAVQERLLPRLLSVDPGTGEGEGLTLSAWSAMYSMDLIRRTGWRFSTDRTLINGDIWSLLGLYQHAGHVSVYPQPIYCRYESNPLIRRPEPTGHMDTIRTNYQQILQRCRDLGYSRDVEDAVLTAAFQEAMENLREIAASSMSLPEKTNRINEVLEDSLFQKGAAAAASYSTQRMQKMLLQLMERKNTRAVIALLNADRRRNQ